MDRHLLFLACRTMPYRHGHGNGLQELLRPAVHDYEYHHQAVWVPDAGDGECEFSVWRGGCVYQDWVYDCLCGEDCCLLGSEMGLGKGGGARGRKRESLKEDVLDVHWKNRME